MTNLLDIQGTQNFMGKEIPVVLGGFGEDKKVILAKTVAELHDMKIGNVNQRINDNISRFKEGVDIIDLNTSDVFKEFISIHNLKPSNRTKNVYLLSERGYAKLIKIMDNDLAWEIHDQLIDEYFTMREIIKSDERLKAKLLLEIYNGGQQGVLASKQLTEIEVAEATKPLLETIEQQQPAVDYVDAVSACQDSILVREVAKLCYTENKIEISQNKLYNILRHWGWVFLKSTEPKQKALDNGYLEVETKWVKTPYGEKETWTTLVKPKGQIYIVQKLSKMTVEEINEINKEINAKRR